MRRRAGKYGVPFATYKYVIQGLAKTYEAWVFFLRFKFLAVAAPPGRTGMIMTA